MERDDFIQAMRGVANSVCVVTTDGMAGRHGATVSAFCSVSADPPQVLVCLRSDSLIAQRVIRNNSFTVNVLPAHASDLANRFAGLHDDTLNDRFRDVPLDDATSPYLQGTTVFHCHVNDTLIAGSHHVIVGAVIHTRLGIEEPLIHLQGQYQQAAPLNTSAS